MNTIIFIKANIISVSPFFTGNDEGEILIDNENNIAFLPATSIAGAFRSYLSSTNEKVDLLFGDSEDSQMSKLYIRDAYAPIKKYTIRNGVRIDGETGSNVEKAKIDREYLDKGLEFNLRFEIHCDNESELELKSMIYKSLNALDRGLIRLGGHKSSGLGIFKVKNVHEIEYDLTNNDELIMYLKREKENKEKNITEKIKNMDSDDTYVEFIMKGQLSTPLIIKSPNSFSVGRADDTSLMNEYGKYIIPGSSFKGVLRSRVEMIAGYFGNRNKAKELFGEVNKDKKISVLSRVFVQESIIDSSDCLEEIQYNRIKLDKFTSGVRYGSLMNDVPVMGKVDFNILYKKEGDSKIDDYAIGLIALALRDLGMENISLGGNSNIGRGKYKADSLVIKNGVEKIEVDFNNKHINDEKALLGYVKSVKRFSDEVMSSE